MSKDAGFVQRGVALAAPSPELQSAETKPLRDVVERCLEALQQTSSGATGTSKVQKQTHCEGDYVRLDTHRAMRHVMRDRPVF